MSEEFDYKRFLGELEAYKKQWNKKMILEFLKRMGIHRQLKIEKIGLFIELSEDNPKPTTTNEKKQAKKTSKVKIQWE